MGRVGVALALAMASWLGVVAAPARNASADQFCQGDLGQSVDGPRPPGPGMRFGIYPGGPAGQLVLPAGATPESQAAIDAALDELRPPGGPFVVHLYRSYTGTGTDAEEEAVAAGLVSHYTGLGYEVEYVLRYKVAGGGDVPAYVAWVRDVVHRYGANPGVIGFQVTNEVNFTISGDSSDGTFTGGRDALIQGVEAAKAQVLADGYGQVGIGFNWFYRSDPSNEDDFWTYLHDHGGPEFAAALDWVGLDAYPGTFFPPAPGTETGAIINALTVLRDCFLPQAGISDNIDIHVQENGWPTGPGRTEADQAASLQTMVNDFDLLRRKHHVTDYRWFDLRDADSASPNFQQQYGIMDDAYQPKPAFFAYRDLVHALSMTYAEEPGPRPSPSPAVPAGDSTLPDTRGAAAPAVAALAAGGVGAAGVIALGTTRRRRRSTMR
ncbi:MAG: hypothetical protein QOE92_470 [Chloroflexota bacterium]|jgi:hypothetical protein|nr:hypothetical protein [Chloroflexota bacterium]